MTKLCFIFQELLSPDHAYENFHRIRLHHQDINKSTIKAKAINQARKEARREGRQARQGKAGRKERLAGKARQTGKVGKADRQVR
jgi:hypothetical protein